MKTIKITRQENSNALKAMLGVLNRTTFSREQMDTIVGLLEQMEKINNETVSMQTPPLHEEKYAEFKALDDALKVKFNKFREKHAEDFKRSGGNIPEGLKSEWQKQYEAKRAEFPEGAKQADDFFNWSNTELMAEKVELTYSPIEPTGFSIQEYNTIKFLF